ncbi:MAG: hypothetical protein BGN92_12840 [Sphingobacteriales bacterium 41-5]|nr:MAG: hypothetical protein ABS67_00485 [Niabella sp. SCN 42-15]OJU29375.1 MAG: hypothetical protein BGN92_12840 [Sphingobacteriales bacterium 41-5]
MMKKLFLILAFLIAGTAMNVDAQPRPPRPPLPQHPTSVKKKKPVKKHYKYKKPKKHTNYYSKSYYNSREEIRRDHHRRAGKPKAIARKRPVAHRPHTPPAPPRPPLPPRR